MANRWRHIGSLAVLLVFVVLAVGSTDGTDNTNDTGRVFSEQSDDPVKVRYEVKGPRFDITYTNASGNTEQLSNISNTWSHSFTVRDSYFNAYISAQNQTDRGQILVGIWIDGQLEEMARSSGAYVIASASSLIR